MLFGFVIQTKMKVHPLTIFGVIGGLGMGMRSIRNYQYRDIQVNIFDVGVNTGVGYILCEVFHIICYHLY